MGKGNGKTDVANLDLEHELPAAQSGEELPEAGPKGGETGARTGAGAGVGTVDRSEVEKLKAERDALLDRLARLQAEFDNARKRAAREQQDFREFASADVIRNILPVLDSFERALKAPAKESGDFRNGVELMYRQLQDVLQKLGVQAVPAVGQHFDPRVHEAIEMVDTTEAEDHQVLEELQRGYKYKDRLLRPAMVRVARNHK
jgi:molecular chaperone GrpE